MNISSTSDLAYGYFFSNSIVIKNYSLFVKFLNLIKYLSIKV